jgi:hypothetical protein
VSASTNVIAVHARCGRLGIVPGSVPAPGLYGPNVMQSVRHVKTQASTCLKSGVEVQFNGAPHGELGLECGWQSGEMVAGVSDDQEARNSLRPQSSAPGR